MQSITKLALAIAVGSLFFATMARARNLPGFPARPNTNPPADDRWELGERIDECHVRPEVADFASLPMAGGMTMVAVLVAQKLLTSPR